MLTYRLCLNFTCLKAHRRDRQLPPLEQAQAASWEVWALCWRFGLRLMTLLVLAPAGCSTPLLAGSWRLEDCQQQPVFL